MHFTVRNACALASITEIRAWQMLLLLVGRRCFTGEGKSHILEVGLVQIAPVTLPWEAGHLDIPLPTDIPLPAMVW